MNPSALLTLLSDVERGSLSPEAAIVRLSSLPFEDTGDARIDHHRFLRTGMPEVIYAAGKTPQQTAEIFERMAATGVPVLATRATQQHFDAVQRRVEGSQYFSVARCIALQPAEASAAEPGGKIAIVCAGTSDLPAAEEAAVTATLFGADVTRLYDVGVAGIHRLLAVRERLNEMDVVIVCAGMEGALPSVVGGLVGVPVIAVPTSVGYGASFGGTAALLGMLNSCSPNVTVVNIDNGFGAAYSATLIARAAARHKPAASLQEQTA